MHPRNPYQTPPDFLALAEAYPPLKTYLNSIIRNQGAATIDFKNEAAQRRLTEAILHRDFGLSMDLPQGRLCPPVPNRLNYILWLEDVVAVTRLAVHSAEPLSLVRGLDIGTGASAIYPLLGCRLHQHWRFAATEIDTLSTEYALKNVHNNGLHERITIAAVDPAGRIFEPLAHGDGVYDFTMCNPPFYASREEVAQSAEAKEVGPHAVCTGADTEMITPGGEALFVGRMVEESLETKDRCRWFTSMLGKMTTLTHVVRLLKEKNIDNYGVTELVQGQTKRWVVAWSFGENRLPDCIGRLHHPGLQSILPMRNTLQQPLPQARSLQQARQILMQVLGSIEGVSAKAVGQAEPDGADVMVYALGNTWSRAARRKKRDAMETEEGGEVQVAQLVCRIRCDGEVTSVVIVLDWVAGRERGLFESFASHVQRKVVGALGEGERMQ